MSGEKWKGDQATEEWQVQRGGRIARARAEEAAAAAELLGRIALERQEW